MKNMYFTEMNPKIAASKGKAVTRFVTGKMMDVAPALTMPVAERLICATAKNPRAIRLPEDFVAEDLKIGDRRIKFYSAKPESEKVILFLHGWSGRADDFFSIAKALRSTGLGMAAFDQVAHGQSEGRTTNLFSFIATATGVIKELQARGKTVAAVVAHSMGGSTALAIAKLLPAETPFVLISPVLPFFESLFTSVDQFGISRNWVDRLIAKFSAEFGYTVEEIAPRTTFAQLKSPLLLIHDRQDKFVPFDPEMKLIPPGYRKDVVVTDGLGHFRILKDPAVVERVANFLR